MVGGAVLAAAAALAAAPASASAGPAVSPVLRDVQSVALALGVPATRRELTRYDLVVVDGINTTAAEVRALHRRGVKVLGYLSVGTIEPDRPWTDAAAPFRLDRWGAWNEWYADVSQPAFRDLVVSRGLRPILARGFDGVFLDNVDMVETHPAQRAGMTALVRAVGRAAHARGRVVFAQNGDAYARSLAPLLDGWNREDVSATYDFDTSRYVPVAVSDTAAAVGTLRWMRAHGVFVTSTDYTRAGDLPAARRAARVACAAGARPFVSNIDLTRIPAVPLRCP